MKWKFWVKDKPLSHLEPHAVAYMVVQMMVKREVPFNKWRDQDEAMPERREAFIQICVNVYQLSIFLDLLELRFGSDVAGVVRSDIIALMNTRSVAIGPFFRAVEIGRATPEREQFFANDPAIQVDCNVSKAFLDIVSEAQAEKDAIYPQLAKSLGFGRIGAEAGFGGLVKSIEFRPETIVGLRKPEDIPVGWSDKCGCFERQLQRRYMNPLFPVQRRMVSRAEILEARAKDLNDLKELQTDMDGLFSKVEEASKQKSYYDEVVVLRDAFERLIFRAAEIGTIASQQNDALHDVYRSVVGVLRDGCPSEHRAKLESVLADSERYQRKWTNQFVRQLKRRDTPISGNEVVASLLTEDVDTVRLFASLLEEPARKDTYQLAVALISDAQREGYSVAEAEQKLQALLSSV